MGTIWVKQLTGGLDTRRLVETSPADVMIVAKDGHVTRGGEFEQRAAFVPSYTLPEGTVGLAYTKSNMVVFGHEAEPAGLPTGVIYQRLEHPTGEALAGILSFDLYSGKVYAVAEFVDGSRYHFYDGAIVDDWYDGRARASFRVTGGTGSSSLSALTVNGVAIISAPVSWSTSNEDTAAAIAAAINAYSSTPEYSATSSGDQVNIVAGAVGSGPNGYSVVATVASGLTLSATAMTMAGGLDTDSGYEPGSFARTIGSKVYSTSGTVLHFSGIAAPTKFTTDVTGAGFIDLANQASSPYDLTAVCTYQKYIAAFAGNVVYIWYVDPDPTLNAKSQILNNTGTEHPQSVTPFGDADIFYVHQSGLRSLKARDSSNSAATTDIGVPIDSLLLEKLQALPPGGKVIGMINPADGRFWLIVDDEVFVFTFYANAKVSAWSTYTLSTREAGADPVYFSADDAVVWKQRVYVRSGDTIYAYGGLNATLQHDATSAEVWSPYFDANRPTADKSWSGVDVACRGTWSVHMAMQPTQVEVEDRIGTVTETTYNRERIPFGHSSSHVSARFRSQGVGPCVLSAFVIHFDGADSES